MTLKKFKKHVLRLASQNPTYYWIVVSPHDDSQYMYLQVLDSKFRPSRIFDAEEYGLKKREKDFTYFAERTDKNGKSFGNLVKYT